MSPPAEVARMLDPADDTAPASLADVLRRRAALQPHDLAYVALSDRGGREAGITFAELLHEAERMAARIAAAGAAPGERALLLCPNGIGFMVGFLGCMLAGVVAVPMMPPRRRRGRDASAAIVADCAPRLALAPRALVAGLVERVPGAELIWLAVDDAADHAAPPRSAPAGGNSLAFLQYTSGSTSAPKGVMVSHASLLANLAMIEHAFGNTRRSTCVSWVPLYHDMGLIINALQSLYVGATCALMAPVAFIQRPLLWLRAISDHRAEVAGGPNFAFDLCVERYRPDQMAGIDLSCWKVAFNGAEPVRAETIERFAATFARHGFPASAMHPAYGMAEATVLVSAGRRGEGPTLRSASRETLRHHRIAPPREAADTQRLVACGRALPGEEIAIVDPDRLCRLGRRVVGEVWVAGPNVAGGYWGNPAASAAAFGGRIAGEGDGPWLRTGDLGFLDENGALFLTGRIKEIVIVRGANHYPQDIEETVQACHPALARHGGAAFTVPDDVGERLVVVQEIERTERNRIDADALIAQIRAAVVEEHDIAPNEIVLLRPGALPKTTSGKIQRGLSRQQWLEGSLDRL